jgi:hypothetical protein
MKLLRKLLAAFRKPERNYDSRDGVISLLPSVRRDTLQDLQEALRNA